MTPFKIGGTKTDVGSCKGTSSVLFGIVQHLKMPNVKIAEKALFLTLDLLETRKEIQYHFQSNYFIQSCFLSLMQKLDDARHFLFFFDLVQYFLPIKLQQWE